MFIKILRDNQLGVLFRLGKAIKVVGPGIVVALPLVDSAVVVELDEIMPGWRGIAKAEIRQRALAHVLSVPESAGDLSRDSRQIARELRDMGERREKGLLEQHPSAPWKQWNSEWAAGRMVKKPRLATAIGLFFVGILWNLLFFFIYKVVSTDPEVPAEIAAYARGSIPRLLLVILAFAFGFLCLTIPYLIAFRKLHLRRYGTTTFVMSSVPGFIGGALSGTVETSFKQMPEHGFVAELTCSQMWRRGDRPDHVMWHRTMQISASRAQRGSEGISFPVSFDIPPDARETGEPSRSQRIAWHLSITTDRRDGGYECIFEVPVLRKTPSEPEA